MQTDLSIIVVNWNVCELLRRCLASIETQRNGLSSEVIVVDSASSDDSVSMVEREFPQVRLIASRENLGYTGGNNCGMKMADGRYLLLLNPDTEIVSDALAQMVAYLDTHPGVGAVGPQLRHPDGSLQPSRRRFPQLAMAFFEGTHFSLQWFPNNKFERAYVMADYPDGEIQSVDWLVGAALMIRRQTWLEVGPLDERFFLYYEEVDWCHRCRERGWEICYLPQAQVIHHEGASTRQTSITQWMRVYRSKVLYYRKYFGSGCANIIRLFLLANIAWPLAELSARWTFGSRDDGRRQQIRAYWQAFKTGLR